MRWVGRQESGQIGGRAKEGRITEGTLENREEGIRVGQRKERKFRVRLDNGRNTKINVSQIKKLEFQFSRLGGESCISTMTGTETCTWALGGRCQFCFAHFRVTGKVFTASHKGIM